MLKLKRLTLIVLLIGAAHFSHAGNHKTAAAKYHTIKVADAISMLQGKGGNIAVFNSNDGLIMVDDDYKNMSAALLTTLKQFGGAQKLRYLINTHWHADHTEGNFTLGKFATIIAHDNVRQRLLSAQEIKMFQMKSQAYPQHALPSITYDQSLFLQFKTKP